MPVSMLTALRELALAAMALVLSLTGTAGGNRDRLQPVRAAAKQLQSVPRLPADDELLVDEAEGTGEAALAEEEETEEVSEEELAEPVDIEYITLRGPISERPDEITGTWTIAGRDVTVTSETHVSTRAANAVVGEYAQVQAVLADGTATDDEEQPRGALVAYSLAVMSSQHMARVVGPIESMGEDTGAHETEGEETFSRDGVWVVSGVRIRVTAATHIVGTPALGHLADIHGTMDMVDEAAPTTGDEAKENDNTADSGDEEEPEAEFVATLIVVRGTPNLPKREREREQEHGKKLEVNGLVEDITDEGTWVVAGQEFQVNDATAIDEKKGDAEVGALVRVQLEQSEDDTLVALQIDVLRGAQGVQPGKANGQGNSEGKGQGNKRDPTPTPTVSPDEGGAAEESVLPTAQPEHGKPASPKGKGSGKD